MNGYSGTWWGSEKQTDIKDMPEDFEIKKFLIGNQSEVKNMCITEYNEAETMAKFKRDGIEEGIEIGMEKGMEKGLEKGRLEMLVSLVKDRFLTVREAAARCNMSVEAFQKLLTSYSVK